MRELDACVRAGAASAKSRTSLAVTALVVSASLAVAAFVTPPGVFLALNASLIAAAIICGCIAWLKQSQLPLEIGGIVAFVGFAAPLVYEWDPLFTPR